MYDIIEVELMPIILHGIASVINPILISTASFIISTKSLFDNLFCNLPYNVTAWTTCNDSSRESYSLERHKLGSIFFFLIQKMNAKLELKSGRTTRAKTARFAAKFLLSSLVIHFLVRHILI